MNPHKKLYRSKTNRMISGICGGIGEYFQIDAVLVRVVWVLVVLCSGIVPGVIAYIIFAYIIPEEKIITTTASGSTAQESTTNSTEGK
ncbi:MAG: PspC domain-containing protein [Patescibacteria group bacterium]